MAKKCLGCGAVMQSENETKEGYIESEYVDNEICRRCFRLKNYGEYSIIDKANEEFIEILKNINNSNDLVVYVMDIFNLSENLTLISDYIDNEILVVLTKRDVIPKSVKDVKVKEWLKKYNINCIDTLIVSSHKNYNFDELYKKINNYKKSNKVYIVGNTNVGKSTLINKIARNYSNKKESLTTSLFPSTTLGTVELKVNDELTFVDTPGLLDNTSIINHIDYKMLKKITPKKEVKPITYQMKKEGSIFIEDLVRIDSIDAGVNSFTLYVARDLKVERMNLNTNERLRDLKEHAFSVNEREDIVINGLGWIKITKAANIKVYVNKDVKVFKRDSII